jgi:hypothetical protein
MKKLFLLTLILFSLFSSQAFACEQQTTTIDYVYYDSQDHTYYMNTVSDASEGFWVLEIIKSDKEDKEVLKALNMAYKDKQIQILYSGNLNNSDEIEIVSSELISE